MRYKISTALIVILAITLLVVLAFKVRIGATADSVTVLQTAGMTCGSCSTRIQATLKSLQGVAVTEVDVAGGWVIVGYDTKLTRPEKIAESVGKAGFGCRVYAVLTPDQFKQVTGREIGRNASSGGCGGCGTKGGCGSK